MKDKNPRTRLLLTMSKLDSLRQQLFDAAPDDEIEILRTIRHEASICAGLAVVDIQHIKHIKEGSD